MHIIQRSKIVNYVAGCIQLVLCIFLIIWLIKEITEPVSGGGIRFQLGEFSGMGKGRSFGDVPVSAMVIMLILFTSVTSCVHIFGYAMSSSIYQESVDVGKNWKRWIEYSITATIMMIVIAISSGVGSLDSLLLITSVTFCCMICGWLSEETARSHKKVSQVSTVIGWILLLTALSVILRQFTSIISHNTEGPPWWVTCIVVFMFLLYSSFGIIHFIHMRKQWNSSKNDIHFNRRIENAYTVTSMVTKILLVVFLSSGLFARSISDDTYHEEEI